MGLFFSDRMMLTNLDADLASEPDGMFLSNESGESGRATFHEGDDSLEVVGTPDMVLEVVSKTSAKKDTEVLRELYWKAGIAEYWLVETRGEVPQLEILRHTSAKYVTTRKQGGWIKSNVFGKSFNLTSKEGRLGVSDFTLALR